MDIKVIDKGKINPTALPTKQAAEYLGVAKQTLANWRNLGKGPNYVKLDTAVLYRVQDLDDWLAAQVVKVS